jgi:hypothetical membrane protein
MFSIKRDFLHRHVKTRSGPGHSSYDKIRGTADLRSLWSAVWPNVKRMPKFLNKRLVTGRDMDAPSLKRAGTTLFVGVGQFAFCFALAEIYYPGYNVSIQTISDLGATCKGGVCEFVQPSSDIFNASIVLLGIMLLVTAYFLQKGSGSKSLALFEGLAGVGSIGVGTFNESYGGAHVFFSAFTFFSIGIQAILVFKVAKSPFSYFSAVTGVITLVAIVLYGTDTYLGLGQGGMERIIVYPVLLGALAFGGYLMALGEVHLR